MHSVGVLDVTLRDGGCVNQFNFGQHYMERILRAQEASGVDYIELGYLDQANGSLRDRTQYISVQAVTDCLLRQKRPGVTYLVMMDYGKFDPNNIPERKPEYVDGIRVAFHKKDRLQAIETGKIIMAKGYQLFMQPMITLRYSEEELLDLIDRVNTELTGITGFYIVDSFGEMRQDDMGRLLTLVDKRLRPGIRLGFHSHNNLQLSYSNACSMLAFPTDRDILLDSSIMGMGKGAGNLNTELLLEHLNIFYGKSYRILPLLEVMDKVLNQLHSEFYWGYAPEYYLSAANHCTPSYAGYFYNKHMLPIDQVGELLGMIAEEKKISFDREYAEQLYRSYNAQKTVDDEPLLQEFRQKMEGKTALLIGPGKSLGPYMDAVKAAMESPETISFGLNLTIGLPVDFLMATRSDVFESALEKGLSAITTSNVSKGTRRNARILNYSRWIEVDERTHDSSFVIVMNLLKACGVKEVLLAGLDGFSVNINDNYADPDMRFPVSEEQVLRRNAYYRGFIAQCRRDGMHITFITPSKYE